MCVEISHNHFNKMDTTIANKKDSYSIRKMFKRHLKLQKRHNKKIDSMESLENESNASLEVKHISIETYENDINERLFAKQSYYDEDISTINSVPVHYLCTTQGTFFWTTTANQIFQDRWAQS
ncbi:enhancer of split m4 protein-like [Haematobia irritans]|uniref:enhancer of split m4 protein-like n=1 Tax=Haematobia irritans TaxID=7368 RepID=UPI003F508C52